MDEIYVTSRFVGFVMSALGIAALIVGALLAARWAIISAVEKVRRRNELTALQSVISECHQIERWCTPYQPTAVATAQRIRAYAHSQMTGHWPDDVRVTDIGQFRVELPEQKTHAEMSAS